MEIIDAILRQNPKHFDALILHAAILSREGQTSPLTNPMTKARAESSAKLAIRASFEGDMRGGYSAATFRHWGPGFVA